MADEHRPEVLWRPVPELKDKTPMDQYRQHINRKFHQSLINSQELQKWTVANQQAFWLDLYSYLDLVPPLPSNVKTAYDESLPMSSIPQFFPGLELNYAENVLQNADRCPDKVALIGLREGQNLNEKPEQMTWVQLREEVRMVSSALRRSGVKVGDVVAALVGNSIRAVVLLLSTAAIGGVFTSINPDLGIEGCVSRLQQVKPKILFADSSTAYKGRQMPLVEKITTIFKLMKPTPSVYLISIDPQILIPPSPFRSWSDFVSVASSSDEIHYCRVPFNTAVMICYSSGTTGPPKCIVHQHGLILQLLKISKLHNSLKPGEVVMQFSSTSWVLFYIMNGHMATGATIICYDGSPMYPDVRQLIRILARFRATYFGTSPRYLLELELADVHPAQEFDLSSLRMVNTTGATLTPSQYRYFYARFPSRVHLSNSAGGTDTATSLIAADPAGPLRIGEMQIIALGLDVDVADPETGESIKNTGLQGELVVRKAFPSMPAFFWADTGNKIYRAAYFERFSDTDLWAQHDWVSFNPKTGGSAMLGRSDGVLNPSGIRFGSGEIYAIVEGNDFNSEIAETLCVGRRRTTDADEQVFLFVRMKSGHPFSAKLEERLKRTIRLNLSPRHIPRFMIEVSELPTTVNGKKVETAVKQVISGKKIKVSSTVANPECLLSFGKFVNYEGARRSKL